MGRPFYFKHSNKLQLFTLYAPGCQSSDTQTCLPHGVDKRDS